MSNLFVNLANNGMINSWASLLDWFFDDDKFALWTPALLGRYTKRLKKMPGIGESNYKYGSSKNLSFPRRMTRRRIKIHSGRHDGEAKDWVRHIRNGIAHGKTRIIRVM